MKRAIISLALLLFLIYSCSNDDDLTQENMNGFFINLNFYEVNKAYYFPDLSTEQLDDFYIVVTNGEIISLITISNEFEFSVNTTNSVVFRGIQNPNTPLALNFVPNGSYEFNSTNERFSNARFEFNCELSNGTLQSCEDSVQIANPMEPNIAIIDIERDDSTENYSIIYNIELSNGININGQFNGILERL